MFLCAIAFVAGLSLYFQLPFAVARYWLVILLMAAAGLLVCGGGRRVGGCLLLGVGYAALNSWLASSHVLPASAEGLDLHVTGRVVGMPVQRSRLQRFELQTSALQTLDQQPVAEHGIGRIRLNWYSTERPLPRVGARLQLVVKLKRARGLSNPGAFDYEKWLYSRRITATGYVRDKLFDASSAQLPSQSGWHAGLAGARQRLSLRLDEALGDSRNPGLLMALAIGDRSDIKDAQWQRYIDTGTNHLLAISGLHISLVAGFTGLVAAFCWRRWRWLRSFTRTGFASSAGLLAAVCYAAMAGFALPAQRALIMLCTLALVMLLARHTQRSTGLVLALVAVCLWDPRAVLSAGLWLSFAAVAVLFLVFNGRRAGGPLTRLLAAARGHLLISVGLAPLTLLMFGQLSLVAPLANLLVVPVVGLLVTPLVFCAALASLLHIELAAMVLLVADRLLSLVGVILAWLADLPLAVLVRGGLSWWALLCALATIALALLPQPWRVRWLLLPLLLPVIFVGPATRPVTGEFEVVFLDVGQGTAVVVRTRNHTLVYDTGPGFSNRFNGASTAIIPLLKHYRIPAIDALVLSHPDSDHVGGSAYLLEQMAVRQVFVSRPVIGLSAQAEQCLAGQHWTWDDVSFEFLLPDATASGSDNDVSCVLMIRSHSGSSALLPGDIERRGEARLLARELSPVDLLMAPHHGSDTSSSTELLSRLRPDYVVYTTGYGNRFGFPVAAVRARYQAVGSREFNTASDGAVTFNSVAGGFSVQTHRAANRRIWNRANLPPERR